MKANRREVLFVSHDKKQCGVYQFGQNVAAVLNSSELYCFRYVECGSAQDLVNAVRRHNPEAVIYNYYPSTMPWLKSSLLHQFDIPHIGFIHEVTQRAADNAHNLLFDYHIAADPTLLLKNPLVFKTGRLVPAYENTHSVPTVPTIGSFGFGLSGKGFDRLLEKVQEEFDEAVIRLHIPFAEFGDADGKMARSIADTCQKLLKKPGIRLELSHEFLSQEELLEFLAKNTLNAFFYEEYRGRGISSVTDLALAVRRPIAITKSTMFRHIVSTEPSICIEDSSLRDIINNGFSPLARYVEEWSQANLVWDYERIVSATLGKRRPTYMGRIQMSVGKLFRISQKRLGLDWTPSLARNASFAIEAGQAESYDMAAIVAAGLNRPLDNDARELYRPAEEYLFRTLPEMMQRKIPEANIQQAFVFDTVMKEIATRTSPAILCVGSYDDTAAAGVKKNGFCIEEVDPVINYDLATYLTKPSCRKRGFDIIFSTSVIEHVADDEEFFKAIGELLAPGGVVVLTCDFDNDYRPGKPKPPEDFRLYTQRDFTDRLLPLADGCHLVDEPTWEHAKPDFSYAGCRYGFASLVFRKTQAFPA